MDQTQTMIISCRYHYEMECIEKFETGYSAYSLDLPACVSSGAAPEDTGHNMRVAIEFHLDGLKEEGYEIPKPTSRSSIRRNYRISNHS